MTLDDVAFIPACVLVFFAVRAYLTSKEATRLAFKQAERLDSAEAVLRHIAEMACWREICHPDPAKPPRGKDCKCFSCAARAYFKHNYPE